MKTCPICGARAFDDAEVCFGCLHRYGEEPAEPRPKVAAPGVVPVAAPVAMSAAAPVAASASGAMQAVPGGRCPAMRPEGLGGDLAPGRAGCEASPSAPAKQRPAAPPRDGAGWTVRFELPGYAPTVESTGREGGLVVRFQPEGAVRAEGLGRERVLRGTHARDAPAGDGVLASAAGCS